MSVALELAADVMSDLLRRNRDNEIDLSSEEIAGRTIAAYLRAAAETIDPNIYPLRATAVRNLATELEREAAP